MQDVTLTTIVKNPETLKLLLQSTDQLHARGLLKSLRVVDATPIQPASTALRLMVPMEGDTGHRVIDVDVDHVKSCDPAACVLTNISGYHHHSIPLTLFPGGHGLTIVSRSSKGCYVGLSCEQKSVAEIALVDPECFVRRGRGGGAPLVKCPTSGVSLGGAAWRATAISLSAERELKILLDTGDFMELQLAGNGPVSLSVSSSHGCAGDVVVTKLDLDGLSPGGEQHRSYVTYYSSVPEPVDGVEIRSSLDIVYIEQAGWSSLISGGVPLVVGDDSCNSTLRRVGLIDKSQTVAETHAAFLSRSKKSLQRMQMLRDQQTSLTRVECCVESGSSASGLPCLICVLNDDFVYDPKTFSGYVKFLQEGPVGESLSPAANHILAYLDSVLENDVAARDFLTEVIEAIPLQHRKYLLEELQKLI